MLLIIKNCRAVSIIAFTVVLILIIGSCQDANFKVKICDSKCDKKFVLKFSNLKSTFEELKFQNDLIIHTAAIQLKKTNGSKDLLYLPRPIEITNLHCRFKIHSNSFWSLKRVLSLLGWWLIMYLTSILLSIEDVCPMRQREMKSISCGSFLTWKALSCQMPSIYRFTAFVSTVDLSHIFAI